MKVTQLSVFVKNEVGSLARITNLLRDQGINIRALSLGDTCDYGIFRIVVSNPEFAMEVLTREGYACGTNDVIALQLPDEPGGLATAADVLADAGVSVAYAYCAVGKVGKNAVVILRVHETEHAIEVLREKGIELIAPTKLNSL